MQLTNHCLKRAAPHLAATSNHALSVLRSRIVLLQTPQHTIPGPQPQQPSSTTPTRGDDLYQVAGFVLLLTWPWILFLALRILAPLRMRLPAASLLEPITSKLIAQLVTLKHLATRLLVAATCGAVIGVERKRADRPAGLRSMTLVSTGSALYTLACIYGFDGGDPVRAAAQVCTGVGFIGAGVLTRGNPMRGVTTACAVWVSAAIGVTAASGLSLFSFYSCGVTVAILRISRWTSSRLFTLPFGQPAEDNSDEVRADQMRHDGDDDH